MADRVLIIEDEGSIQTVIQRILSDAGFETTIAANGRTGLQCVHDAPPNLVVLDLALPDIGGADICRKIRADERTRAVPILILTGCSTAGLPADCLNAGADDFLPKPFDARELAARVQAILRRPRLYLTPDGIIERGSIRIQNGSREIVFRGAKIPPLTPKEFLLMKVLVTHSPNVVNKAELARLVWEEPADMLHPRTVDVHVRRLRIKLGTVAGRGLKTVPAIGYQWVDPAGDGHDR